ncbi:MAG TPA: VanW family protein [Acidimicrobiales bacterium]|nr:VanW family protein [Acidimicrobiales bacterium]
MRGARRFFLFALAAVAGLAALVAAAWAVDTGRAQGEVVRNVTLGGRDVGGMSRTELEAAVRALSDDYAAGKVTVRTDGPSFTFSAAEVDLALDEKATAESALEVGRDGNPLAQALAWVRSFADPRTAPLEVVVDDTALHRLVAAADEGRIPPTEPSVRPAGRRLEVVEGKPGRGVDAAAVREALPDAVRRGDTLTVRVTRGDVPPRFSVADARKVASAAESATTAPLAVSVDGEPAEVPAGTLRSWVRSVVTAAGIVAVIDQEKAEDALVEILEDAGTDPVDASFTVVGNVPRVVPGRAGTACCAPGAGVRIEEAFQARLAGRGLAAPVALPVRAVEPERSVEEADALGIKEPVGTFTTNFAANQSRVRNIHRMADLVRGQVILPGATFSINAFVGERTEEKGFVTGGVIEDGKFTESIGGGISQFATTTFNAAFFAGLEFPEYQSHSLYISRYPYGREATLSWPKPDLRIRNPSPHGVLIWPTYTSRSVTVTLYSTRWVDVVQSNQTTEARGPCTRVRTERTRTVVADGTKKVDTVAALYRPAEGVKCT